MRHEYVGRATSSAAREKEQVAVAGQIGCEIGACTVDRRAQVRGGLPGAGEVVRIGAGALRHPDVERPGSTGSVRREVEAETVSRERGVLLVGGRVDDGAKVHRLGPLRVGEGHGLDLDREDRKSTRLNSSHPSISYAVFCLKKK